jgi:multidrug efflux pump subunit AcrA (membrane-fusion protein)
MKLFIPVLVAAAAIVSPLPAIAQTGEADSLPPAQVTVVRAVSGCFAATVNVTGFIVARSEAIVSFDLPGYKIVEILAAEGDRVTSGQTLVRLSVVSGEGAAATLKSPAAGVVTRSTAAIAATASPLPGEPLFRIAIDNDIELEAEIPSIHVPMLSPGQAARIQIEDSRELSGRVRLVPAAIDQRTQLGRARLSLERAPEIRLGMFASATIDADRSCGISVPRSSVTYRTEGTSVQIVRGDVIQTRRVQIGFHSDTQTEVRDGVSDGDMIVANAGSSLRDGDRVRPIVSDATRSEQR